MARDASWNQMTALLHGWASRYGSQVRQVTVTMVDQASYSVANFTISLLLARWLSPRDYGSYVLAFAALMFIGGFQNALVLEPLSVFGAVRYRACFRRYLSVLARYQTAVALVVGLTFVAVAAAFPSLLPSDLIRNTHGLAIAMPAVFLAWLVRRAFYVGAAPREALITTLVQSGCALVGLTGLVRFGRLSGFSALLVVGVSALCGAFAGWARLPSMAVRSTTSALDTRQILIEHWRFGGWLALTNLAYWAAGQGFIIVIAALIDVAEVGAFNAMQNFVTPVAVMVNAIGVLILPSMATRYAQLGRRSLQQTIVRVSVLLAALTLVGFVPILAFGSVLTDAAYGGRYGGYHWILGYLIVARTIGSISITIGMGLRVLEASHAVFIAYLSAAGFTLVAAPVAAVLGGLRGIAVGIVLGEIVLASALWIQWVRQVGSAGESPPVPSPSDPELIRNSES